MASEMFPTRLARARDGRYVCVVEGGDPAGFPVFYFHGAPGSRIGGLAFHDVAARHGIRLLVADRPGMGFSEPSPGRSVGDWADDVQDVAGCLGLTRFGVFGASGGGPYALACARFLPEEVVLAVAAMCPGPMADDPRMLAGYNGPARFVLRHAARHPGLMRAVVGLMTRPSKEDGKNKFTELATGDLPSSDIAVQAWLESLPAIQTENDEVRRQGLRGAAQDLACIASPWGFDVTEISAPVALWHGQDDAAVPVSTAKLLAELIRGSRLNVVPGGHYIAFSEGDAIFAALRDAAGQVERAGQGAGEVVT